MSRDVLILAGVGLGLYLLLPRVASGAADAAAAAAKGAADAAGQALDDASDWLLGPRRVIDADVRNKQPSQVEVDAAMDAALSKMGKTRADLESPDLLRAARELAADLARQGRPAS